VTVRGSDVKEVSVKADAEAAEPTPRKDGLRVLSTSSSYSLSEKGNVVTLDYGAEGWTEGSADFDITVPSSTTVVVASSVHGISPARGCRATSTCARPTAMSVLMTSPAARWSRPSRATSGSR